MPRQKISSPTVLSLAALCEVVIQCSAPGSFRPNCWANCTIPPSSEGIKTLSSQIFTLKKPELYQKVKDELKECNLKYRSPQFNQCTQRLHSFLQALANTIEIPKDHALGLTQKDDEYLKRSEPYTNLNFMKPAFKEQLLNALDQAKMGNKDSFNPLLNLLHEHNRDLPQDQKWRFVAFDGNIGAIDNSDVDTTFPRLLSGRGMISIPEAYFQAIGDVPRHLYLNFSIVDQAADPLKHTGLQVSALPVYTHPKTKERHFAIVDHWREKNGQKISITEHAKNEAANKADCRACHVSGPIAIRPKKPNRVIQLHPQEGALGEGSESDLKAINRLIASQTSTIEGEPMRNWPSYGAKLELPRDQAFIESCFESKPTQQSVEKIRKSMSCTQCHDTGKARNALLVLPFSSPLEAHRLILQGEMPPRSSPPLYEDEKNALMKCLDLDRIRKTKAYLTEIPCEEARPQLPLPKSASPGIPSQAVSEREQKGEDRRQELRGSGSRGAEAKSGK